MSAALVRNATDVRKNFRQFFDQVLHEKPQAIVRHGDDMVLALSVKHLEAMLDSISFTMDAEQEPDGSVSGSVLELPVCENASSTEELELALARGLVDYADVYLSEFERCFHSPNLRKQFAHVMKVYMQPSVEAVARLINGQPR